MRRRTIILALALTLMAALPVFAAVDTTAALNYLKTQQNHDGGFGSGFSPDSTVGSTADVVLAMVAVRGDPSAFSQDGNTPVTYLAKNASSASTAGDLAKLILAAVALEENPRHLGNVDSVSKLEAMIDTSGRIGGEMDTFVSHLLAVLALSSVQRPVPAAALDIIKNAQQDTGGWAWDGSEATAADTNTTAFAVQALVAAGEPTDGQAVTNALAYYKSIQNEDGGWPYQNPSEYGTATDANSTAVVIQAIIAAGQDPTSADWTMAGGKTPISALEALQNPSGAFAWQTAIADDNLLATVQALPALAGKAFPLSTMAVGEASAAPPSTMPVTGAPVPNPALPLLLGGLALTVGAYALYRRK
jgi:prenyltransferase beta subunit